ncbi:MAG: hypothetical protein HZA17_13415 [Nitrospirae bacterium]|nr:hypothetical protein [Nitrospirota bacterium]
MEDTGKAKKFLLFGAISGGILSLAISILMDSLFSDIQGTWRDAIAKDLNSLLSLGLTSKSFIVNIVFILVLGILAAFGSFMGFIFSFFLYKFFDFLGSK